MGGGHLMPLPPTDTGLREKVPNTNYVLFLASFFKQTFFIHLAYIIAMKLGVIIQVIGEKVMYK